MKCRALKRWRFPVRGPCVFLVLIFASGRAVPDDAGVRKEIAPQVRPDLTVATYNINWGNVDLAKTAAIIRKAEADLVLLQETNAQSEIYLRRALGGYAYILFQGHKGRYSAERFGIASKLPVRNLKFIKPVHGLFGAWVGEVDRNGRKLQFANVHLQPILVDESQGLLAAWLAFQRMEDTHGQEIEDVYKNLSPKLPTLIAGDFNSLSQFAAPKFLTDKQLVGSFAAVTGKPDSHPTWRWRTRRLDLSGRVDYIFHSREFQTVSSKIVPSEASDHHLLVSRLQWAK